MALPRDTAVWTGLRDDDALLFSFGDAASELGLLGALIPERSSVGRPAAGAAAGSGAVAVAEQAATLRCLDATHPRDCVRCVPPPAHEDSVYFVLRGNEGAVPAASARATGGVPPRTRVRVFGACA
jgi:hypothetical protein